MATNSYVQVPPDSTGKKLHTQQHTVDAAAVQIPVNHLADPTDPTHIQSVDNRGQASVRFAEGSPTMDAFGNLRVSNAKVLGAYEYSNNSMADLFTDTTVGAGTITYQAAASQTVLSVSSANGDSATRITNRYHYYQPGVGNLVIITLALGDTGKVGNTREWGYADDANGFFFRLEDTTIKAVLRSSTSGSMVESVVPRSSWNGDKLDGSGKSGMTIDLTKANFFWYDYAWLGVGPVRFGVLAEDGSRWVCHTFENPNSHLGPYMATGSLPIYYKNYNTSATASTTEMKLICCAVYSESSTDYTYWRFGDVDSGALKTVSTNTPLVSMKPALLNGSLVNRVGLYPEQLSIFVQGGPIKLSIVDDGTLTGATFTPCEATATMDKQATAISGGSVYHTVYLGTGTHNIDISFLYESNDEGYHVLADGSDAYTMSLVATKLNSGDTVTCSAIVNYRELR